jgi:methionine-rich copper-binding protein CopC
MTVSFLLLAGSGLAWAHAIVIASSPQNGAALSQPPERVILRFNAKIEKSLAHATLTASDGRLIPLPIPVGEHGSKETPNHLEIPLPPLAPGVYVIHYKVLATDGHATQGVLRFSIAGAP